jgi:hypothetical protein
MLLYLIKHSRPNLVIVVREFSKSMDAVSIEIYKDDQSNQICVGFKRYLIEIGAQPE